MAELMVISFFFYTYLCLIFVHIFLNQLEKCPLLLKKLIAIAHIDETVPCSDS